MSTCICSAGSKTGDYSHSDYCPIGKDQRIAELEAERHSTDLLIAHTKHLEQQLAELRKWQDIANEVYPVVTAHIDRLLLNQEGEG